MVFVPQLKYNNKNKTKMNNPYSHLRRRESKQPRRTNSVINQLEPTEPKPKTSGLNTKFLSTRRENILNTGYNVRKNKLQEITAENKKIYVRINSQKTVYSRAQMNKSYESNCSISRRLSESKISKRNSSRSSMRSSQVNRNNNKAKPNAKKYEIKANSVSCMKDDEIKTFKNLFKTNENHIPAKQRRNSVACGLFGKNNTILPPIRDCSRKSSKRPSAYRMPLSNKNEDTGFLHKIAEEMFGAKKGRDKNNVTIN